MSMTSRKTVNRRSLSAFVGGGYGAFWHFKGRYRVCKGSRASKKSKTTALWYAAWLNKKGYEGANLVVFRKTYRTLKDSCFTDLKWALDRLGAINDWAVNLSPLEMTRKSTGQKILFRGLDDPLKVASITVSHGSLCWAWLEEAYEVMDEADFDMLDETIRGECQAPLFKQWTITFNPWNERHWLKNRFFDVSDEDTLAITTNYLCNEWLDDSDRKMFEEMKARNPRRYQVAGLGDWGIVEGLVYENWREEAFTLSQIGEARIRCGLDFGYTQDPSAFFVGFIDTENRKLWVWDEIYQKKMSNRHIFKQISMMGYGKERITADSAEPKSIDELKKYGLRVKGARKGKDSINNGIQFLQDYEIIVHPRCVNFLTEISNYSWSKDRFGKSINVPIDDFNHLMDAMRYAVEDLTRVESRPVIQTFKGGI